MIFSLLCKTTPFNFFHSEAQFSREKNLWPYLTYKSRPLISGEELGFKEAEQPTQRYTTVHGLEPRFPHFYWFSLNQKLFASVFINYVLELVIHF